MKKTVLIVDDFENTTWVIKNAIKNDNYEILLASNGAEALKLYDGRKIDLLITDLNMPELDGLQLISEVKAMDQYKFTPIILLTTERNADKLEKAQKMMITAIINKPFELDKFRKIVAKCLTQSVR